MTLLLPAPWGGPVACAGGMTVDQQQFREVIQGKEMPRFLIHDRDSIYSLELDLAINIESRRLQPENDVA